jgi:hypothetical protein
MISVRTHVVHVVHVGILLLHACCMFQSKSGVANMESIRARRKRSKRHAACSFSSFSSSFSCLSSYFHLVIFPKMSRTATVSRDTSETQITCTLGLEPAVGAKQEISVSTGIGFLDHVSFVVGGGGQCVRRGGWITG